MYFFSEERKKQDKEKNGFDRGLKPAEILSATNTNGIYSLRKVAVVQYLN